MYQRTMQKRYGSAYKTCHKSTCESKVFLKNLIL